MATKIIDRQWPLAAMAEVGAANVGSGNGVNVVVPPGAVLLRVMVLTTTLFNGTTPTLTVGDGTTTFANAVDIATVGNETVGNAPKYYPTGGTISVTLAGTAVTSGKAFVIAEYLIAGRGNEIAE